MDVEDKPILIKLYNANNGELQFRVKRTTPFSKILEAWSDKTSVQTNAFKFSFDGEQIDPCKCPADYDMQEGDVIDIMPIQTGGF